MLIRRITTVFAVICIVLTWVFLAGLTTAAHTLRAAGIRFGHDLTLPARMVQPTGVRVMAVLGSAGTLLLIVCMISKLRQDMKLALLAGYICCWSIYLSVALLALSIHASIVLSPGGFH